MKLQSATYRLQDGHPFIEIVTPEGKTGAIYSSNQRLLERDIVNVARASWLPRLTVTPDPQHGIFSDRLPPGFSNDPSLVSLAKRLINNFETKEFTKDGQLIVSD